MVAQVMTRRVVRFVVLVAALHAGASAQQEHASRWETMTKHQRQAVAAAAAKVGLMGAVQTATEKVGGQAVSGELVASVKMGNVIAVWEIVVIKDGVVFKVDVDAASGRISGIDNRGMTSGEPEKAGGAETRPDGPGERQAHFDFEADPAGERPAGWRVVESNGAGTPAVWKVDVDDKATRGKRVVRLSESLNAGGTFNLLLLDRAFGADVSVTTRLRADAGEEDQGGGVAWRHQGGDDYYVARWNPLERNLRLYKVEKGRRTMLASTEAPGDLGTWHVLHVSMVGSKIEVTLDDRIRLAADDATFAAGGKIALWTKADARTSFDDLIVKDIGAK